MPFAEGFSRDLLEQLGNQVQPLLVSDRGRFVWSETPFRFAITAERVEIHGGSPVLSSVGSGLRDAVLAAGARHFPPTGTIPHELLFTKPQYNTWIELQYEQNQAGVLAYAERLIAEGYPPGVLMIDDTWQYDYGHWRFPADRFPDPAAMVRRLHELGFLVMLWVCPQVSSDGRLFLDLRDAGLLVRDAAGEPAIRKWWNGYSALLDLTNPKAADWLQGQLDALTRDFGIDGFKFDAGDFVNYEASDRTHVQGHPGIHSAAWAAFAERWPLNELRACWQLGNRPLAQRLRDKRHSWDEEGIAGCLPNILAQSLTGHPYSCPDMVGGGEYQHFNGSAASLDGELFVRHAQMAALLPMQQFSAAPWRVLDAEHAALCLAAARLHAEYGERILALARHAARSGEPIVRPLAWIWNDPQAAEITDQFLLGDDLLVAPVVVRGARSRRVLLPPGTWREERGSRHHGPGWVEVGAPLDHLPRFHREAV
jgi:alpha-glucosidase (family GH31 glycosyl hydrolase)